MKTSYNPITISIALITILALCIFGVTLYHAVASPVAEPEASVAFQSSQQPQGGITEQPSRLKIPSLNIDANVQKVGISIHGTMAVPSNFTDVGWYKYGPIPGNPGNSVIAGHLDNGLSLAGVFKHLNDIKLGDEIDVVIGTSTTERFTVIGTSTLDYNTQDTTSVFGTSTRAQLKLITCEGTWDEAHKTYDNRLVVTAQLI